MKGVRTLYDTFMLQSDLIECIYGQRKIKWISIVANLYTKSMGKKAELKNVSMYLSNDGKKIEEQPKGKDLSVKMSNGCSFTSHIKGFVEKTNDMCGWILRTFSARDKDAILTLYNTLLLPYFDYCSQFWSRLRVGLIQNLQTILQIYIEKITGMRTFNNWEEL